MNACTSGDCPNPVSVECPACASRWCIQHAGIEERDCPTCGERFAAMKIANVVVYNVGLWATAFTWCRLALTAFDMGALEFVTGLVALGSAWWLAFGREGAA